MKNVVILTTLLCLPLVCAAKPSTLIQFQCDGTFTDYTTSNLRDLPVKGIYLELADMKIVKIAGAPGFDTTYTIMNTSETGVGFQADANVDYSGFFNRFSGQLSITQRSSTKADGTWSAKQQITATCKKATPLF